MARPTIHLVATLKNEAPYLVEWLAHYRAIGVGGFTLFTNDCTDGTNLMLDRLQAMGEVRHYDNPLGPRMDPQRRAYSRAARMEHVRQADWVLVVDGDEFVQIDTGDGTLPALIAACAPADAISLGWRLMGSGGARRWVDAPVTERFTQGGALDPPENGMVPGFKTLFRPGRFDYFGVHRPKFDKARGDDLPSVIWRNGSGREITPHVLRKGWRFTPHTAGYAHGWVNHYAVKSREEFLLKRLRGSANTKDKTRIDIGYWSTFDLNSTPAPPFASARLREEADRLLRDAELAALRRAGVASARRLLDDQLADPAFARFVTSGENARVAIVARVGGAAADLPEWIAWHRLIGIDRFIMLSGPEASDGTPDMLDRLEALGIARHVREGATAGADLALPRDALSGMDWVIRLGVESFLEPSAAHGTVADLVASCDPEGTAHAISLPICPMGSHGHATPPGGLVTHGYLRGSRIVPPEGPGGIAIRTLFRPEAFRRIGAERPGAYCGDGPLRWLNGSGDDVSDLLSGVAEAERRTALPPDAAGFVHGHIRHYGVKSRADFAQASGRIDRRAHARFVLANINTRAFRPLGGARLRHAVAALLGDPVLSRLHSAALDTRAERLGGLANRPDTAPFIATGRPCDDPAARPARLLCIATHHKTGTMWMRETFRAVSDAQGLPLRQVRNLKRCPPPKDAGPMILVNWDGDLPRALHAAPDARILHLIRDPRDVLISGMRYHLSAPTARERFLLERRPAWNGNTYQGHLASLPGYVERLLFEMEHKHRCTVEEMLAWHHGRAESVELRYEDLLEDTECRLFRSALDAAAIEGLDIGQAVRAFRKNALFGGLRDANSRSARIAQHVASGAPRQWVHALPREVATVYAERFGAALRVLGYAETDDWVAFCRPAAEIGSAHAAE